MSIFSGVRSVNYDLYYVTYGRPHNDDNLEYVILLAEPASSNPFLTEKIQSQICMELGA